MVKKGKKIEMASPFISDFGKVEISLICLTPTK